MEAKPDIDRKPRTKRWVKGVAFSILVMAGIWMVVAPTDKGGCGNFAAQCEPGVDVIREFKNIATAFIANSDDKRTLNTYLDKELGKAKLDATEVRRIDESAIRIEATRPLYEGAAFSLRAVWAADGKVSWKCRVEKPWPARVPGGEYVPTYNLCQVFDDGAE